MSLAWPAGTLLDDETMIADRRFKRTRLDTRFAAGVALSAGLIIAVFGPLFYTAIGRIEAPAYSSHCEKLAARASGAAPAEKVRLFQEYHEAYCD